MTDIYPGMRRIGINIVNIKILINNIICITFVDMFIFGNLFMMVVAGNNRIYRIVSSLSSDQKLANHCLALCANLC